MLRIWSIVSSFAVPDTSAAIAPWRAHLWRGPKDLWLTTGQQAMRLSL